MKDLFSYLRNVFEKLWLWILFFLLLLLLAIYSFFQLGNENYWLGAMGNLLATMIGVIAGVPVVLWIERKRQAQEEKEKRLNKEIETKKVLSLIKDELIDDQKVHDQRKGNKTTLPIRPFKTCLWEALSNSGEIKALRNPDVLNLISSTYYLIDIVKEIESTCYKATRGINVTLPNGIPASMQLLEEARSFDKELEQSLSNSITSINTIIGE